MQKTHLLLSGVGDRVTQVVQGIAHLRGSDRGGGVLEGLFS